MGKKLIQCKGGRKLGEKKHPGGFLLREQLAPQRFPGRILYDSLCKEAALDLFSP